MVRTLKAPPRTGDDHADARAELRWAMAGAGLTPDKFASMPGLLRLPALRHALAVATPADAPAVALDVVANAARTLGGGFRAQLLRCSLAIEYEGSGKDLSARREELVRVYNDQMRESGSRRLAPESPRALYEVERQMIEALVALLGAPAGLAAPPAEGAPVLGDGPARRCGHVSIDATCRFAGRHIHTVETIAVIRALVDGVSSFSQTYYCTRDGGVRGQLVVREGGVLAGDDEVGRPNFRVASIELPRTLRIGETHRLRFDVTYPGRAESEPWFAIYVRYPVEFAAVRLSFDPACVPSDVWRMERVPSEAHRGDRAQSVTLRPDRFGYVEAEFVQPDVPLNYGIAWEW